MSETSLSNFSFIATEFPEIFHECEEAERSLKLQLPEAALNYARKALEAIVLRLYLIFGLPLDEIEEGCGLWTQLSNRDFRSRILALDHGDIAYSKYCETIRRAGNEGSHRHPKREREVILPKAAASVTALYNLVKWFALYQQVKAVPVARTFDYSLPPDKAKLSLDEFDQIVALARESERRKLAGDLTDKDTRLNETAARATMAEMRIQELTQTVEEQRHKLNLTKATPESLERIDYQLDMFDKVIQDNYDDFEKFIVALNPNEKSLLEQIKEIDEQRSGSYRLNGVAGSGKTVVLLRRAYEQAKLNKSSVLVVTFSASLAEGLTSQLKQIKANDAFPYQEVEIIPTTDPRAWSFVSAGNLAARTPGIYVYTADQLSLYLFNAINRYIGGNGRMLWGESYRKVFADRRVRNVLDEAPPNIPWQIGERSISFPLPYEGFLEQEYSYIVLPKLLDLQGYQLVERTGRGQVPRLPRNSSRRAEVYNAIEKVLSSSGDAASNDELARAVTDFLNRYYNDSQTRLFEQAFIDEGQDMTPAKLLLIRSLLAAGPNDLFITEDAEQRIYGSRVTLAEFGIDISGGRSSKRWLENYRNSKQILTYAQNLNRGARIGLDGNIVNGEAHAIRNGPPVREVLIAPPANASDLYDEKYLAELAKIISDTQSKVGLHYPIAILVRQTKQGEILAAALNNKYGLNVKFITNDNSFIRKSARTSEKLGSDVVRVMTMHRAKGIEFRKVIVDVEPYFSPILLGERPNYAPSSDGPDAGQIEEFNIGDKEADLLYVATTRATDELVLMVRGERSILLPQPTSVPILGVRQERIER